MQSRPFLSLKTLLCAVFFFAAHALAASAVLGVDLGTEYIKAALVKPGTPIEIVLTKDSRRKEAATIAFKPAPGGPKEGAFPERLYGSDALAVSARFPADVYSNLKALLGLVVDDAVVQEYAKRHPAIRLEENKIRGTVAFKSRAFTEDQEPWLVEELLAMQLQSIQKNAEEAAGPNFSVRSIVLTVPSYFTVEERRAVKTAADLAGLKVLSLISDGLAVGLHYATSREFPNIKEGGKPEHHMVFDMGAGSTKATIIKCQGNTVKDIGKFNKTIQEVQVLATSWDRTLGGDALNALIVDDMVEQFVKTKGAEAVSATAEGVKAHGRAVAKLSKDAIKIRQVLSANTVAGGSFEGLYEDVDFKYKLNRADFETMTAGHAERLSQVVKDALKNAQLESHDLTSIILHGGTTRTPFVQKILEDVIGSADKIRTNVNSDEAAVLGAGFRAAELSPSFRVKEIKASEGAMYPSGLKWTSKSGKEQNQRLWSATSPVGGAAKEVTFTNTEDFDVTFYQQVESDERNAKILTTKNLTATVAELKEKHECPASDVRVKISLRLRPENGEVVVDKAHAECEVDAKEGFVDGVKNLFGFGKKDKDQQPLVDDDSKEGKSTTSTTSAETASSSSTFSSKKKKGSKSTTSASSAASPEASEEAPKKKLITIPLDYSLVKTGIPTLSKSELQKVKDRLKAFDKSDRDRAAREESLNQLEAFTYKVRDHLESESFVSASTESERKALEELAHDASEWLYGDGADAVRDEFKKRLDQLKGKVNPIVARISETSERPSLVTGLKDVLNQTTNFIFTLNKQIDDYEAWQASSSSSSSSSSTTTSTSSTTTSTESTTSTNASDFDGLEDEDAAASPAAGEDKKPQDRTMEDLEKESGPVPPLYKREDLAEIEAVYKETKEWLESMEAKQAALPPTADAVMTIKDLKAKREHLDKVGFDLAMKGVKSFSGGKGPKPVKPPKKDNKPKPKSGSKASSKGAPAKPKDGPKSQEEIEEMIRKIQEDVTREHEELLKAANEELADDSQPKEDAKRDGVEGDAAKKPVAEDKKEPEAPKKADEKDEL